MAKLTDIPVVTSLDDADLIYAVDVSDTTDDPAGSSVAITKANFGGGGLPAGTVVKEEIGRITDPVGGTFDFSGLDLSTYDTVYLSGSMTSARALDEDQVFMYVNGDQTQTNYDGQLGYALNSGHPAAVVQALVCTVTGTTSPANRKGYVEIFMKHAGDSATVVEALTEFQQKRNTGMFRGYMGWAWNSTAAVTQIELVGTAALSGTVILYGERTL